MELNKTYFYTATILNWNHLLHDDKFKLIIIDSLKHLVKSKLIRVYGYVIMPNHIHLIWQMLKMNGKEMPHASFMKFTGHQFLKQLRITNMELAPYTVNSSTQKHHFWERESLAIELYTEDIFLQKLNYIHNNPVKSKWQLAQLACDYHYSSAAFYENGIDRFNFLTHFRE
ncbi:MAG: transposase [Chitinophagales bacterium]